MNESFFAIRDSISVFSKKENSVSYTLAFLFQSSRFVVRFKVNAIAFECIKLLDGNHSLEEIAREGRISERELFSLVDQLKKENIVIEGTEGKRSEKKQDKRYARQLNFFSSFEDLKSSREDFQRRITSAHVVVVGCGGIGSWLIESLVRSGIGKLTIIDPDIVQLPNLSQQGFFGKSDIGKGKAEAIRKRVKNINASTKIEPVRALISSPRVLNPFVKDAHVVVNCSDYPDVSSTNAIVSRACFRYSIPHVLCGGYDGHLSFVGQTVIPGTTSCWYCYVEGGIYEKAIRGFTHLPITECATKGGTLPAIAAITANIHALEVIRVLTGYAAPLMANHKAELDFLSLSLIKSRIPKYKNCSLCGKSPKKRG